jgi:repressor LexA
MLSQAPEVSHYVQSSQRVGIDRYGSTSSCAQIPPAGMRCISKRCRARRGSHVDHRQRYHGAAMGIAMYTLLNRRPPAEADFQQFFQVTPPAVHQMIIELERRGLISRVAGQPRTIKVTVPDDELPRLQPIKTSAVGY